MNWKQTFVSKHPDDEYDGVDLDDVDDDTDDEDDEDDDDVDDYDEVVVCIECEYVVTEAKTRNQIIAKFVLMININNKYQKSSYRP